MSSQPTPFPAPNSADLTADCRNMSKSSQDQQNHPTDLQIHTNNKGQLLSHLHFRVLWSNNADRVARLAHYWDWSLCLWHNLHGLELTIIGSGKWKLRLMKTKSYGFFTNSQKYILWTDQSPISYKLRLFTLNLQSLKCLRWYCLFFHR